MDAKDRRIAELETKVAALEAENAALKASDVQRKPAYMEAVKKTVRDFPYMELAGNAFAIGSKVSKNVYEVDTLYGILMRGEAKVGAGKTPELLAGKYTPGVPLKGACPIVTDNHLGLHDAALVDWRSAYGTYAAATTIGAIIFAGDAEGFATWAKSKPCRDEVAGEDDGADGRRGGVGAVRAAPVDERRVVEPEVVVRHDRARALERDARRVLAL